MVREDPQVIYVYAFVKTRLTFRRGFAGPVVETILDAGQITSLRY